jgi:hypothetical protein
MNLEIKQLATKHALYVDGGGGKTNYTFTKESLDEFVKEIANECSSICEKLGVGGSFFSIKIQEHFEDNE